MALGSGAYTGSYSFGSRFEQAKGTNPEELIGAAHAGCYSMALSGALERAGHPPERVHTDARVHLAMLEGGPTINRIDLTVEATVPGLDDAAFQQHAQDAKKNCPVSRALAAVEIHLEATLNA
jgi:osmotically inducible protein OsmC